MKSLVKITLKLKPGFYESVMHISKQRLPFVESYE
jgi:hypothetical protein